MKHLRETNDKRRGRLFNFRPALFAAAFLALGIAFAYGKIFKDLSFWWLLLGIPAFGIPFLFVGNKLKALVFIAVLFLCFSLGALSFSSEIRSFQNVSSRSGTHTVFGVVAEKEDYGSFSRVLLSDVYIDGKREDGTVAAYLGTSFNGKVALSDEVSAVGELRTDISAFGEYGFRSEDIVSGTRFCLSVSSLEITGKSFDVFRAVRARARQVVYAGMDEDCAAVTYALLTGDTAGIESGLLENVRRGGIAHIFAVSGLHVRALYAFGRAIFEKSRLKRLPKIFRFLFTAAALFFYGGVCGFSPSVVRATVMCLVTYASFLIGTKSDLLENTGIAALLLLAVHPAYLFGIGFRLSFAACLSVGIFSRTLRDGLNAVFSGNRRGKLPEDEPPGFFARTKASAISFFAVTLSAQIGTAPLLLDSFGYISVWSLLLNCAFVPLIGAAFSFLLALVFAACAIPAAASVLLYLPSTIWSAVLLVFYAADFSLVISGFRFGVSVGLYYAFFISVSDKINLERRKKILLAAVLAAAFAGTMALTNANMYF